MEKKPFRLLQKWKIQKKNPFALLVEGLQMMKVCSCGSWKFYSLKNWSRSNLG